MTPECGERNRLQRLPLGFIENLVGGLSHYASVPAGVIYSSGARHHRRMVQGRFLRLIHQRPDLDGYRLRMDVRDRNVE
ncbi:hypothetical protein [Kocuria sp. TGY1127_2]|uniref:hypothetical protein n=1 Tax=Kocuria sp. TGY1127_2 TaxID=2711328 RepID=UPI0015BA158C|nr:hypothetical protein [Kocuria sp. TGY1127_2]